MVRIISRMPSGVLLGASLAPSVAQASPITSSLTETSGSGWALGITLTVGPSALTFAEFGSLNVEIQDNFVAVFSNATLPLSPPLLAGCAAGLPSGPDRHHPRRNSDRIGKLQSVARAANEGV